MKGHTMKPKRLILKPWQVAACLRGEKTQHRVIAKPQPPHSCRYEMNGAGTHALCLAGENPTVFVPPTTTSTDHRLKRPYPVGSEVWVAETWATSGLTKYHYTGNPDDHGGVNDPCCAYAATATYKCGKPIPAMALARGAHKWKSPSTMPYWAARLRYTVTDARCQRVQDISEADAVAEGCGDVSCNGNIGPYAMGTGTTRFAIGWEATHGPGAWSRNDWVWALTLERKPGGVA